MRSWFAMASPEPNDYTVLSVASICIDAQSVQLRRKQQATVVYRTSGAHYYNAFGGLTN